MKYRWNVRQIVEQTEKQRVGKAGRQTNRQTEKRQTYIHINTQTERQTDRTKDVEMDEATERQRDYRHTEIGTLGGKGTDRNR